jgi:hypothetical protein
VTPLGKPVTRDLCFRHRGAWLVARMTAEGIYLKGRGQRWTSAYLLPWAAAFDVAVKIKVQADRDARRARRRAA